MDKKPFSLKKSLYMTFWLFLVVIGASQCFAQSQTGSADLKSVRNRQYLEIINSLYYYIQQNYVEEVDPEVLYQGALKGMLDSLKDPHSAYLSKDEWRNLSDTTNGSFGGVGLSISKPSENTPEKPAYVLVAQPIDGSPGEQAGIQSGDRIIKIDGVDTSTITMNEVLSMLRGTVGEPVTVTIRRGKTMEFDRTLIRAVIETPSVKYGMIHSTGYIKISEFSTNTAAVVQQALESFEAENYNSLIIDLRNNGGGLLNAAVAVVDKFVDNCTIVETKSRIAYENQVFTASPKNTVVDENIPVIVLINRASASASEIVAGALKDTHRAYLVGEKSYGKGSVQIPTPLIANDGFKITVAKYYSPTDVNIDKIGIPADRKVDYPEFTEDEEKAYSALMSDDKITEYVENHPGMTDVDIGSYAVNLQKDYNVDLRIIRKVIRNEVERTRKPRLYDLDYDVQLNAALDMFANEDVLALSKSAKTLKEIQAESDTKSDKK